MQMSNVKQMLSWQAWSACALLLTVSSCSTYKIEKITTQNKELSQKLSEYDTTTAAYCAPKAYGIFVANLSFFQEELAEQDVNDIRSFYSRSFGSSKEIEGRMGACTEDTDADGLKNSQDQCPFAAEDIDQVNDSDGCPDIDDDGDGILDVDDKCPDDPEDINGTLDDDGCPETKKAPMPTEANESS